MYRQNGFTLIEVMVVVVIIAILAAIAVPQYSDYVTRSKIADAVSGLSDSRVRAEQYFQDNRTYVGACVTGANSAGDILANDTSNFQFRCSAAPTATTYSLSATGIGSMNGFVYTVDQSNARQTTNALSGWATSGTCWVLKKDGSC